jgi:hypothetical protein
MRTSVLLLLATTLPEPNDARVTLRELPPVRVGKHGRRCAGGSRGAALRASGEPEVNRYDPPWTPWSMRRNEVWIALD